MKKVLLVSALLAVSSTLFGKEVTVAPVVKSEPVVAVVAPEVKKEVVVEKFRPTGHVTLSEEITGGNYVGMPFSKDKYSNDGELFTELLTDITFAPKHRLELKAGVSNGYNHINAGYDKEARVRYFYQLSENTKLRGEYKAEDTEQTFSILAHQKLGGFYFEPEVKHFIFNNANGVPGNHRYHRSLKIGDIMELPMGIELDLSAKLTSVSDKKLPKTEDKFFIEIGAIATKSFELYKNDTTNVKLNFEGGYDTYKVWTDRQHSSTATINKGTSLNNEFRDFYLYAEPKFVVNHALTSDLNVFGELGLEYGNQVTEEYRAQKWTSRPAAKLGLTAKF